MFVIKLDHVIGCSTRGLGFITWKNYMRRCSSLLVDLEEPSAVFLGVTSPQQLLLNLINILNNQFSTILFIYLICPVYMIKIQSLYYIVFIFHDYGHQQSIICFIPLS